MKKLIFGTDVILALSAVVLSLIGLLSVYSATRTFGGYTSIIVQFAAVLAGVFVMLLISVFDYEQFLSLGIFIFVVCVIMLAMVLVLGMTGIWGSKSWIKIGRISIQPSELAKVGFIITFAVHLFYVHEKINKPLVLAGVFIHAAIPVFLILLQPDFGTAAVFVFIFAVMLIVAGLSAKIYLPVMGVAIAAVPVLYNFLDNYQKNRILVFINPDLDPKGAGYNVIQSKLALGSGKLFGLGYLKGVSTQGRTLPAKHTDFIFSTIGEEWGFFGAVIVAALLFFVVLRIVITAKKTNNLFGRLICIGGASMIFFHSFENMGMCMGLMPVTGIPLPFISYGGTAVVTNFVCIGLVLSVARSTSKERIFIHDNNTKKSDTSHNRTRH